MKFSWLMKGSKGLVEVKRDDGDGVELVDEGMLTGHFEGEVRPFVKSNLVRLWVD